MQAALGYTTKPMLLTAAHHNNLVTFPGIVLESINKHFLEYDETAKCHWDSKNNGVRSTRQMNDDDTTMLQPTPGINTKMYTFVNLMLPNNPYTQIKLDDSPSHQAKEYIFNGSSRVRWKFHHYHPNDIMNNKTTHHRLPNNESTSENYKTHLSKLSHTGK
jgi:hypothetical protein